MIILSSPERYVPFIRLAGHKGWYFTIQRMNDLLTRTMYNMDLAIWAAIEDEHTSIARKVKING